MLRLSKKSGYGRACDVTRHLRSEDNEDFEQQSPVGYHLFNKKNNPSRTSLVNLKNYRNL